MNELGKIIKDARKQKGLTRRELADKFKETPYPISISVIERIENDKNKIPPNKWLLQRLAYLLEIDAEKLYKLAGYNK